MPLVDRRVKLESRVRTGPGGMIDLFPQILGWQGLDDLSVCPAGQVPVAIAFGPDGTKLYVLGNTSDRIHQYTLSTAWDLTTAGYDSLSFLLSSQDSSPLGFAFSSNGSKFFMLGINEVVYQYSGF